MTNDHAKSFVIELRIAYLNQDNNQKGDKFLTFKIDGQRFKTSTKTIKFCTDSTYQITLTTRPVMQLDFMVVAGVHLPFSSTSQDGHYQTEWSTSGMKSSTKSNREDVLISFQGPSITITTMFQCKFYDPSDSHSQWGTKLEYILLKCSLDHITNSVQVMDQEFR